MNLLDFGSPQIGKATKPTKAHNSLKSYDNLATAELIRRTGKSSGSALRGDQVSTILASRRRQEVQDKLGRQLTDYYQAVLREPVPHRIMALVEALEAQQGN
ncbi:MAG: NepR family anti-sigma factor [Hyphomicrobiales bacterium]